MIGRDDFVALLRKRAEGDVLQEGKLVEVEARAGRAKVLRFEDVGEVEADLVVGADDIWSAVRRSLFECDGAKHVYAPHYEGLGGMGSFCVGEVDERRAGGRDEVRNAVLTDVPC